MGAAEILDRACERHGEEAWREARAIRARIRCGGLAFTMRGNRGLDFTGTVSTGEPNTVVEPYRRPGRRGVFEGDRVWIEQDGEQIAERDDPRPAFRRLRRQVWWDDLDLLYFCGYALWNYLNLPFLLRRPGFELGAPGPVETRDGVLDRLEATFPPDVPTHSRRQTFYFDADGRLRRHDYTAEVFGGWAKAAHVTKELAELDGLLVGTRRRVTPRGPGHRPLPGPTLVWIEMDDLRREPAA